MFRKFIYNYKIAYEAILQNKLRAALTSLGIICGVASVIAMLAIGKGGEQEIIEKMKLLGTNNIIIKTKDKKLIDKTQDQDKNTTDKNKEPKKKFSPGLTLKDAESVKNEIPHVKSVSPEIVLDQLAFCDNHKLNVKLVGIDHEYFNVNNFFISNGSFFLKNNFKNAEQVCIISTAAKIKFFPTINPINQYLKCGQHWLKIIGVFEGKTITKENIKNLGIRDYNYDVYIPITTMLLRYSNRSLITKKDLASRESDEEENKVEVNLNQIDRIVVSIDNSEYVSNASIVIAEMLKRRHNQVDDYEIVVPESLLEQEQSTKRIFNIVLGAIASISLLVGGIGIMNIMLASIMERTKEIGIRRAIGASQHDILLQFLSEAVALSLTGGFIGIATGFIFSFIIEKATGIHTIISPISVFLSFLVSISVGLIFGITPARKASLEDPIELLRYD